MPKYLNADGVRLLVETMMESIKSVFAKKGDAVKSISRSGTTFTATRADGSTFTFTQKDDTVQKSPTVPLENGVAAIGDESKYAAGDHIHPHDSTKVDKVSGKGLSENDFTSTHKTKLEDLPDANTLSEVYVKKKLDSKTFTDVIGAAANWANATFFFGTIYPESYYATWKIQYRIYAEAAGSNVSKAIADVTVSGTQSNMLSFSSFNSIANTSYRPAYYNELYRATSDGYEAGYGHALGVRLYSSWNATTAANARTITVDILSVENCEFEFFDNMLLYANIPGTGSTNYSAYSELNFLDNGLQETGDANQIDRLLVQTSLWLAGTNGLKAYGLFMQDADGAYQSFTLTSGTAATKAKNPVGFVPGNVWYLNSSTNVAAGSLSGAVNGYISFPFDFRYSSNCASTLINGEPIYLVFTEGNDGLVYLADVWWTQSLPTTDDGYVYMYLGQVYANRRSVHLSPSHPMYKFYDGAVREWFPGMRRTATSSSDGLMSASDKAKLDSITPLRMNNGVLEYFDGSSWVAVPLGQ